MSSAVASQWLWVTGTSTEPRPWLGASTSPLPPRPPRRTHRPERGALALMAPGGVTRWACEAVATCAHTGTRGSYGAVPSERSLLITPSAHGDQGPAPRTRLPPAAGEGGVVSGCRDTGNELTRHGSRLPSAARLGAGGRGASASGSASPSSPRPAFARHPPCAHLCPQPQWTSTRRLQCGLLLASSNEAIRRGARREGFASESGGRS